jgi:hypothetical protein
MIAIYKFHDPMFSFQGKIKRLERSNPILNLPELMQQSSLSAHSAARSRTAPRRL